MLCRCEKPKKKNPPKKPKKQQKAKPGIKIAIAKNCSMRERLVGKMLYFAAAISHSDTRFVLALSTQIKMALGTQQTRDTFRSR